jgi:hypothetical protein
MFGPCASGGLFLPTQTTMSTYIDLDLVDSILVNIPDNKWDAVKDKLIECIIDEMPAAIMQRLTGTRDDFDKAEKFLHEYYAPTERNKDLIVDSFQIFGDVKTCYCLDLIVSQEDSNLEPQETME